MGGGRGRGRKRLCGRTETRDPTWIPLKEGRTDELPSPRRTEDVEPATGKWRSGHDPGAFPSKSDLDPKDRQSPLEPLQYRQVDWRQTVVDEVKQTPLPLGR